MDSNVSRRERCTSRTRATRCTLYANGELISFLEIVKLQTEAAYNTLFGGISHTIYELFTFIHNL